MRTGTLKRAAALVTAAFLSASAICTADEYEDTLYKAIVLQNDGDRKGALEIFRKAVRMEPEEPVGHFLLGRSYFLMQMEEDAVRELKFYQEKMKPAQGLDGEKKRLHISNLHGISEIYFSLGRYDEAKGVISEILTLDPDDQTAYYNMGVCYYFYERNRSKAYQNFKKVISLDPDTYMAKKASYAIEFMRNNPDPRVVPDFSFLEKE